MDSRISPIAKNQRFEALFELARHWIHSDQMVTDMFLKFFFRHLSLAKQADFMKRRGIVLGTRKKDGRESYLYMVNDLFAEIRYENDNPRMKVETLVVLDGLNKLNRHLENDLRSRYY